MKHLLFSLAAGMTLVSGVLMTGCSRDDGPATGSAERQKQRDDATGEPAGSGRKSGNGETGVIMGGSERTANKTYGAKPGTGTSAAPNKTEQDLNNRDRKTK
jgi:hypothetical protein